VVKVPLPYEKKVSAYEDLPKLPEAFFQHAIFDILFAI
jgi:hypothetical protein